VRPVRARVAFGDAVPSTWPGTVGATSVVMRIFLAFAVVSLLGSAAHAKDKKPPPPPVPTMWFATFDKGPTQDADSVLTKGFVTVPAGDPAPPEIGILINAHSKDQLTSAANRAPGKDGAFVYDTSYVETDNIYSQVFVVVENTLSPVAVKPTKSVKAKIQKLAFKAGIVDGWSEEIGVVDLDSDKLADLAIVTGCTGEGVDGACAMFGSVAFARDGKGWKQVGPLPD
jgi:hypothetical protein